ncbi:MAG: hypothetical protein II191_01450, partial [Clostridia bacterium]|nr:hypothetical protein [Clostridia bacterium]
NPKRGRMPVAEGNSGHPVNGLKGMSRAVFRAKRGNPPRGRKFESSHPDHVVASFISLASSFLFPKSPLALIPLLLLSAKGHARIFCSVVNALTTKIFRYQPFAVSHLA